MLAAYNNCKMLWGESRQSLQYAILHMDVCIMLQSPSLPQWFGLHHYNTCPSDTVQVSLVHSNNSQSI